MSVKLDGSVDPEPLRLLQGVSDVTMESMAGATRVRIAADDAERIAPDVCALASERGWKVRELRPEHQTLEELFVQITGGD